MNQLITQGIVLRRTDYGEADRILTILTPEHGKLRLMARGVRRPKSKLAGGIELFSTSDLVYIKGKGDLGTLVSARLLRHYGAITTALPRVQLGYELIALMNKSTEDEPEPVYYHVLESAFQALDNHAIDVALIRLWFEAQLLHCNGYTPNLHTDSMGDKLDAARRYNFSTDDMAFTAHTAGRYGAGDIKVLRLLFSGHDLAVVSQVQGVAELVPELAQLVRALSHA